MPDIKYKVSLDISPEQVAKTQAAIKELESKLEPFRTKKTFDALTKELQQFQKEASRPDWYNHLNHGLREIAGEIPVVGKFFSGMLNGATLPLLAITAAVHAMQEGYRAAIADEQKLIALDQALANRNALNPQNRQELRGQAEEIETRTGLKEEQTLGVQTKLLQFGAAPADVAKLTEGIINLAGALNGDIDRASQIYVRALNGNFTAANRLGLQIDKTGGAAKQMAQLLAESERVGGGSLERLHDSSQGVWKDMANEWHRAFVNIGYEVKPLGDLIGKTLGGLAKVLNWDPDGTLAKNRAEAGEMGKTKNRAGGGVTDQVEEEMDALGNAAGATQTALDKLVNELTRLAAIADKLHQANLADDLAKITRAEATGAITKEDAVKQFAVAKANAERESAQEHQADAAQQFFLLSQRQKELEDQLSNTRAPAQEAAATAAPALEDLQKYIANLPAGSGVTMPTNAREFGELGKRQESERANMKNSPETREAWGLLGNIFDDQKTSSAITRAFETAAQAAKQSRPIETQLRDTKLKMQDADATWKGGTARLSAADNLEDAALATAERAERKRRDKADEDRLRSEADAAEAAAKNFADRRAALALKHAAELKAIQDEIDQGLKTPAELQALEAKKDAAKKKNAEDDRKLSEQQLSAQDRLAKLKAKTMAASARTPGEHRAAIVAERDADLTALRHKQTAEKDTDKKAELGAEIGLVGAQYTAKLRDFDMQHTHLDTPKPDVDHFAKIGLFVGSQAPALDFQKRTADAVAKLAAWAAAGARVTTAGAAPQPGRFA